MIEETRGSNRKADANPAPLGPVRVWAIPEEYFTIAGAAQMLNVSDKRIRSCAGRDDGPMPFRCFEGKPRGAFTQRDDLREWVGRNTVLLRDEKAKRRNGQRE